MSTPLAILVPKQAHILGLVLLAAASPALAAPPGAPSPSYGKVASWKQRFFERRDTQWRKPAGDLFPSRKLQSFQKLTIAKPVVNEPLARGITANTNDPRVRVQAQVATADKNAPFDSTGGFAKNVRRSASLHRITWEKRIGKLGLRIASVFKAKSKRSSMLGSSEGPRAGRAKVFRANGRPKVFRAVKHPAPAFRRFR